MSGKIGGLKMSEVTILKRDFDCFEELSTGYPYREWLKEHKYSYNIHTQAKYILEMNDKHNWNMGYTGWVNSNKSWLEKVKNGDSLRTIISVISITKLNNSDMEDALLTKRPLHYESGDDD